VPIGWLQETGVSNEDLSEPMTFGVEPYLSRDYAEQEADLLWAKVWQHACRVEEIPAIGDYVTYDICNDSIIVVRTAADTIRAYHNVCMHRGRRLVDDCGHLNQFRCRFHGWRWDLDGQNSHVVERPDWGNALANERIRLRDVRCDTWGGWVWINLDPDCKPLREYLQPVASMLGPFQLENMRYRWRQWVYFDCNWKTAMEAFIETYDVEGTHPQLLQWADFYTWSRVEGLHSVHGFAEREAGMDIAENSTIMRSGKGGDPRVTTAELHTEIMETVNASTTETLVKAAQRLIDELPKGTPAGEVMTHWFESARRDDARRGVVWPEVDTDHYAMTGIDWHVFPNMSIQHGYSFALVYRSRPAGSNPDKCIFEVAVIELFPKGQEPKTQWVYAEPTQDNWRKVLAQDFANMAAVQRGMKSRAFPGALPNPKQERPVTNFHRNLASYMGGRGAPTRLE
jgi:phenylpropionate dioxygenase-like ring-hydroxylating dioxygenase large terminal subunit